MVAWRDALLSTDHHSVELRLHTDIDAMPLMSVRATLRRCDREDDVLGFFVNLRDRLAYFVLETGNSSSRTRTVVS